MLKDYSLRQYALAYAKVGMAVFPLVPKSKILPHNTDFRMPQRILTRLTSGG